MPVSMDNHIRNAIRISLLDREHRDASIEAAKIAGRHAARLKWSLGDLQKWLQNNYGKIWVKETGMRPGLDFKDVLKLATLSFKKAGGLLSSGSVVDFGEPKITEESPIYEGALHDEEVQHQIRSFTEAWNDRGATAQINRLKCLVEKRGFVLGRSLHQAIPSDASMERFESDIFEHVALYALLTKGSRVQKFKDEARRALAARTATLDDVKRKFETLTKLSKLVSYASKVIVMQNRKDKDLSDIHLSVKVPTNAAKKQLLKHVGDMAKSLGFKRVSSLGVYTLQYSQGHLGLPGIIYADARGNEISINAIRIHKDFLVSRSAKSVRGVG